MILVIDFGSQLTKLIARKIREIGVYCEIVNSDTNVKKIKKINPKALILSGGPASVNINNSPKISKQIIELGLPILGICYGQQIICHILGGKVETHDKGEFGRTDIEIIDHSSPLFNDVNHNQVWMSHNDRVNELPPDFKVIAKAQNSPMAAISNEKKKIYCVQFHPEVTHTIDGKKILENFAIKIANCQPNWNMDDYANKKIMQIKKDVADDKAICALSGGVDSAVAAMVVKNAIGNNLLCLFIDNGLLRENEAMQVQNSFKNMGLNLITINAEDRFLTNLKNITDPEEKRKIIGKVFIEIFEEEAKKNNQVKYLVQGTIYPDVIESSSTQEKNSVTIKSHHNVGGLPKNMKLQLIEPLRELFKDEVRNIGLNLNMPKEMIGRHPFPGPGLAVRIIGEVTKEKCNLLRKCDYIFIEEIKKHNLYDKIWQAFAVLTDIKTVGVMGDARTYDHVVALRAINSVDGMTADIYPFTSSFLQLVANRIVNEVKGVSRVVYDYTSKPPATIEWE